MRELILDHGSEFGAHRIHDDGSWNSKFKGSPKKIWYQAHISQSEASSDERKARTVFRENMRNIGKLSFIRRFYRLVQRCRDNFKTEKLKEDQPKA